MASAPRRKDQADWFAEFKKLNPGRRLRPSRGQDRDGRPARKTGSRDATPQRRPRFEIDECQATLYRGGLLTVLGVGKNNRARAAIDLSEGWRPLPALERFPIGAKVRVIIGVETLQGADRGLRERAAGAISRRGTRKTSFAAWSSWTCRRAKSARSP